MNLSANMYFVVLMFIIILEFIDVKSNNILFLIDATGSRYGPLIVTTPFIAIQDISNSSSQSLSLIKGNLPSSITIKDTQCDPRIAISVMIDAETEFGNIPLPPIFGIGSECSSALCNPVGLLSGVWNSSFISYGCVDDTMNNPTLYPTFVRTVGIIDNIGDVLKLIAQQYKWYTTAIMASSQSSLQVAANAVRTKLDFGKAPIFYTIQSPMDSYNRIDVGNLNEIKANVDTLHYFARIIICIATPLEFAYVWYYAYQTGYMLNGGYTFIAINVQLPVAGDEYDAAGLYPFKLNGAEAIKNVYEGVIIINEQRNMSTSEWLSFADKVRQAPPPANFTNPYTASPTLAVPWEAGLLYDAVLLWALIANDMLRDNQDITDGSIFLSRTSNYTFSGANDDIKPVTGPLVMDVGTHLGNRIINYDVNIVNSASFVRLSYFDASSHQLVPVANGTWLGGHTYPPLSDPPCSPWDNSTVNCGYSVVFIVAVSVPLVGVFVFANIIVIACLWRRKMKSDAELYSTELWKVNWSDIERKDQKVKRSRTSLGGESEGMSVSAPSTQMFIDVAMCKGKLVAIKVMERQDVDIKDRIILQEIKEVRHMNHDNINSFVGACVDQGHVCLLMMYAPKGSLQDVLQNVEMRMSLDFKISISMDIANGMHYLHESAIGCHGHLTSSNCLIDSRWTCKVTDYGMLTFRNRAKKYSDMQKQHNDLLWTAPELLRLAADEWPLCGTKEADVYAYAIIVSEILTKDLPYALQVDNIDAKGIIERVRRVGPIPYRPYIPPDVGLEKTDRHWRDLLNRSWEENPLNRMTFSQVKTQMKIINGGKKINVIDNMIRMLEQHTEHLEELVESRTQELDEEKKKVENLLYNILPRTIANQLKRGKAVDPETYESVTIYFSDIVGFTSIAFESTPLQVVTMLNKLYSQFDEIIDKYDVYKVETIGDAYMVVSGCPIRNEDRHAGEVATMSLHLLSGISSFKIPHLPEKALKLRIGLHSGPSLAGVVGQKMPRYCLFGETVSIASKMESSGAPLKIHISRPTYDLLSKEKQKWHMVERGEMEMKTKGKLHTFWITGKEGFDMPLPDMSLSPELIGPVSGGHA